MIIPTRNSHSSSKLLTHAPDIRGVMDGARNSCRSMSAPRKVRTIAAGIFRRRTRFGIVWDAAAPSRQHAQTWSKENSR